MGGKEITEGAIEFYWYKLSAGILVALVEQYDSKRNKISHKKNLRSP